MEEISINSPLAHFQKSFQQPLHLQTPLLTPENVKNQESSNVARNGIKRANTYIIFITSGIIIVILLLLIFITRFTMLALLNDFR